ncbi:unnamed protein product [Blepharisma stoltei]|uniref:Ribosomal protein S7 n=1 Tax=Blepharisma stoltei TaxID=1481888 RepID=A0AAU9K3P5_9CILI|nr:unnamed protein product [Blepharisma stoltei]
MERYVSGRDSMHTDRSLNSSKIEIFEQDFSVDGSDLSLYDSFSFSKQSAARRFAERNQIQRKRSPKKKYTFKGPTNFEYEKLLAISEIRYIQMYDQLKRALLRNKKIMCMNIIYAIRKFKPLVLAAYRMILRMNLRKWKCNTTMRKTNKRKMNSWGEKISGFLRQWRRIHQRNLLSALLVFKMRGIQNALILKSRKSSDAQLSLNLTSIPFTPSSQSINSSRLTASPVKSSKLDESTKKEFKKAIKGKFKDEEQVITRPGGLMRYFR